MSLQTNLTLYDSKKKKIFYIDTSKIYTYIKSYVPIFFNSPKINLKNDSTNIDDLVSTIIKIQNDISKLENNNPIQIDLIKIKNDIKDLETNIKDLETNMNKVRNIFKNFINIEI